MLQLSLLPKELINIICLFAWDRTHQESLLSAFLATEVKTWGLHEMFIRKQTYDWSFMTYKESPLDVCSPEILPKHWFRFDVCILLLQMLDFRRKEVRCEGNRMSWIARLRRHWESIKPFSEFYFRMITSEQNWRTYGFHAVENLEFHDLNNKNTNGYNLYLEP